MAGKPKAGITWRLMGSHSHLSYDLVAWLEQLGEHTHAAYAIVFEAGGRMETREGTVLSYANPSEKLNPYFVVWGH